MRRYEEGWIEFEDKMLAKFVALTFNGAKIGQKKNDCHYDDVWNIRYLPKFKWENLVESNFYEKEVKKIKLDKKVKLAEKDYDYYIGKVAEGKTKKAMLMKRAKKLVEEAGGDGSDEEELKTTIRDQLIKKKKPL